MSQSLAGYYLKIICMYGMRCVVCGVPHPRTAATQSGEGGRGVVLGEHYTMVVVSQSVAGYIRGMRCVVAGVPPPRTAVAQGGAG